MADLWIESIGLVAGFIGIVAWIPQIRRVWVDEKEEGISLTPCSYRYLALALARLWNHCQFDGDDRFKHLDACIHHCDYAWRLSNTQQTNRR